jgi:hypothetical protein
MHHWLQGAVLLFYKLLQQLEGVAAGAIAGAAIGSISDSKSKST